MNFYLLPALECGPAAVSRILQSISADRWDTAMDPDRFTLREVVAHLADWEPIMRKRIEAAVTAPGSTIEAFDEGQMAIDNEYSKLDPIDEAGKFIRERAITANYLRCLGENSWSNVVNHPERGPQTAEDLANLLLGHDLYHIEQLSAYLG